MLTFKGSPNFEAPADMDTDNVYMVTVEASDGTTDNVMQAVTVTVTNVDEPGNGDPVGESYGCPHDAAAGWRHNHGGL